MNPTVRANSIPHSFNVRTAHLAEPAVLEDVTYYDVLGLERLKRLVIDLHPTRLRLPLGNQIELLKQRQHLGA